MAKGNKFINKSHAKDVENGCIVQELTEIEYCGRMYSLFSSISPTHCIICGNTLNPNEHYDRSVISSYGIIRCPVTYWICSNPNCKKHHHDILIGVTGSANYSDEYIEKIKCVRYDGRCTLWNSCTTGEIFTKGLTDELGRAPCPTTLWKYEQKQGRISAHELTNQNIDFNGVLHIDGYWVKTGWRKYLEAQLGKKLTTKEWKKLRYKAIYVVATEDKVVLDFQITDTMPSYLELVPLLNRIKTRIPEGDILKVVSDEEGAIIGAVAHVLPNAIHSFCVFHQLKNVTKKYIEEFGSIENIPSHEVELYELANDLIAAETVIESTLCYKNIMKIDLDMDLSKASKKVVSYAKKIYFSNRKLLEMGFTPETNNAMEQFFALMNDIVNQARSFKIVNGLANFCYNLFVSMNNRCFNTGPWRGFSPLNRAKIKYG